MEGDTILLENITDTFKQTKQRVHTSRPQEDIIDNNAAAKMGGIGRVARAVKSDPFAFEDSHHTGVEGGCIPRSERHDGPAPLGIIGSKEREFFLVQESNSNLMVASFVIQRDEE